MSFVNKKAKTADEKLDDKVQAEGHANWMGGHSFDLSDPIFRLRLAASSCFFGEPMYYHRDPSDRRPARRAKPGALTPADFAHLRGVLQAIDPQEWRELSPAGLMEQAIDDALEHDPAATLAEAVRLRNEEHIRTTPQVILVRAAHHPAVRGTGMLAAYAGQILRRADEPAAGLAYHIAAYGERAPIPNALKKAWRRFLESQDEYQLAKYRLGSRQVKAVDVVNLVHPKSAAVDKLVRGDLKLTDQTWEALVSRDGSTTEAWAAAIEVMGHMALLRNLRNLVQNGVPVASFLPRLVAGAQTGKQLPFRYFAAYKAVGDQAPGAVRDAIEECLMASLGNLPSFPGRLMALCDNSGSAQCTTTSSMGTMSIAEIGNLQAILAAMRAEDGHVGVFGDGLETFAVRPRASVFHQLEQAEKLGADIGQCTENGIWLFWDQAIREKEHWDTVFVFSDMQAGHGGLYGEEPSEYAHFVWDPSDSGQGQYIDVPRLIAAYRREVNPGVMVYLVQIAGHQDTIVPEWYDRTFILGGWGEGLLRFAASMAGLQPKP